MRDLTFDIKGRDQSQPAFDSARRNARGLNAEMDQTRIVMNAAGAAARAFAAGFALTSVAGFAAAVRDVVRNTAALGDEAARAGVSLRVFQEWKAVAEDTRIPLDSMVDAFKELNIRADEFAVTGKGSAADAFRRLGMTPEEVQRGLKEPSALMLELIQRTQSLRDVAAGTRIFDELFGGTGAEQLVRLLQLADGEIGNIITSAHQAGRIFDDEMVKRADELDREFNTLWRNFETFAKTAILNASFALRDGLLNDINEIGAAMRDLVRDPTWRNFSRVMIGDDATAATMGATPDDRIRQAFQGDAYRNDDLSAALANRYGRRPTEITVTPAGADAGRGRRQSTAAVREQVSAYDQVIERLQLEQQMIGLSAVEQRVLTEQRRAGVDATSEQGQAIDEIIRQIERERQAMEELEAQQRAVNDAIAYMAGGALDAFFSWAEGAATAEEAALKLGKEIVRLVAYAALLGQGPLAGLFGGSSGGSGGGILGALLGGVIGARASGGPVDPWGTYIVGENGPEILRMGGRGGHVVSNRDAFGGSGGGGAPVNINVNIQTPDASSFARNRGQLEASLARAVQRGQRGL